MSSSLRIRVAFEDSSVLTQAQRSQGMNQTWILIQPIQQLPKISDVSNHIFHMFNLHTSCPNGILLFMEGFVLPPSESTRILKDNDIICVKRKGVALGEVIEGPDTQHLLEVNGVQPVDNGMLLLANEEFDKETGGYQSESEDAEEEKLEEEPSPKEKASKKRKASTKLRSSKKRKRSGVTDGVEDEVPSEDDNTKKDECFPTKLISKKSKTSKEKKSGESETIITKFKSPSKVKRKKKRGSEVASGAEDEAMTDEIDKVNNGERQESTVPDVAKKVPSRSARRKKAKRQWRRELAKISLNPDTHMEPEIAKANNKEANGHPEGLLLEDQVSAKLVDKEIIKQEESNGDGNGNVDTAFVPRVVRPGHIRFEPLDEDEDSRQIEVPNVPFQWNGITSKKKGQKWGIEKFSTSRQDDSQITTKEPSTKLPEDTPVPLIGLNDFDHLPLCSSPKEGDVIAYRLLELSSSWTPELSSFRVGKISHYEANDIVLMPVPEYPIVVDKMDGDEDGPDNSLYKEDGSLETKFAALVDVRSVKQSNPGATKAVSNGVDPNTRGDDQDAASKLLSISNGNKTNLSKDPTHEAMSKEGNTWDELNEALMAKKSELLEMNEDMKKDSGRNKWSYRALRGSAIGPTMAMLRSSNNI